MIARRIITVILFALFFLVLELNQNTVWGWILLAVLTAAFVILFESGLLRGHGFLKVLAWVGFIGLFAGIFVLTFPPVKRVQAKLKGDISETDIVALADGSVRGIRSSEGVELFAGIPYAAPPVGELRWKEPQAPEKWEGVLECDTFAPMSMQPRNLPAYYSLAEIIGYHDHKWFDLTDNYRPEVSEDALYVNVWRPAGGGEDLPVLVYIHGGSLQTGQPWFGDYSGESLAGEGVIVVNMGYRLGVFGYLALDELKAESANGTTGNYGMLDQIKALEWVRDNIAAFGGDPGNVTLAGESAGAASVSALCTSPLAKGLFRRVIMESSTSASKVPPHSFRLYDEAVRSGEEFKKLCGANTLAELRALPAGEIVNSAYTEHHMTVDGYALTETPYESYMRGVFNEEAALHGFNSRESGPFILFGAANTRNFESKIRENFGAHADEILKLYPAKTDGEAAESWAEIYGAAFFDYPHFAYERLALSNGVPSWEYYFSKENGRLGPWHGGELIYAYGNIPENSRLFNEDDRELSRVFMGYFLNFIRTGDPNGEGLPEFAPVAEAGQYMELGQRIGPMTEKPRKLALFEIFDAMNEE